MRRSEHARLSEILGDGPLPPSPTQAPCQLIKKFPYYSFSPRSPPSLKPSQARIRLLISSLSSQCSPKDPVAPSSSSPSPLSSSAAVAPATCSQSHSFTPDLLRTLVRTFRQHTLNYNLQLAHSRKLATVCSRELRRGLSRTSRTSPYLKSRRVSRSLQRGIAREQRLQRDARRRADAAREAERRAEEQAREEERQRLKFSYLLSQTEAFARFVLRKQANMSATDGLSGSVAAAAAEAQLKHVREFDSSFAKKSLAREKARGSKSTHQDASVDASSKEYQPETTDISGRSADVINKTDNEGNHGADTKYADADKNVLPITGAGSQPGQADVHKSTHGTAVYEHKAVPQPSLLRTQLRPHQLRGLNWLVSLYNQGINGILADDMGLGKTVQAIALLAWLAESGNEWGPFLIVTPASTLHNWESELNRFVPHFKVLLYYGSLSERSEQRRMIRSANVVLTSYQVAVSDEAVLKRISWRYMVLDEAQAIKSISSVRWQTLLSFRARNRCLLTGTPVQNNLQELWSLLHFIMPTLFDSLTEFRDWFTTTEDQQEKVDEGQLARLHAVLRPFMLRRHKEDIKDEIGTKAVVEIKCGMSAKQRLLYDSLRVRNVLCGSSSTGASPASYGTADYENVLMQLKKACNHPFLFGRPVVTSSAGIGCAKWVPSCLRSGMPVAGRFPASSCTAADRGAQCVDSAKKEIKRRRVACAGTGCESAVDKEGVFLIDSDRSRGIANMRKSEGDRRLETAVSNVSSSTVPVSCSENAPYTAMTTSDSMAANMFLNCAAATYRTRRDERKTILSSAATSLVSSIDQDPALDTMFSDLRSRRDTMEREMRAVACFGGARVRRVRAEGNAEREATLYWAMGPGGVFSSTRISCRSSHFARVRRNDDGGESSYWNIRKATIRSSPADKEKTKTIEICCKGSPAASARDPENANLSTEGPVTTTISASFANETDSKGGSRTCPVESSTTRGCVTGTVCTTLDDKSITESITESIRREAVALPVVALRKNKLGVREVRAAIRSAAMKTKRRERGTKSLSQMGASVSVPQANTLIADSGKLRVVDNLLDELKSGGHKVLIYFQMTKMMDLFEEYLVERGFSYIRLDGSVRVNTRRDLVKRWQAGEVFIFILSTRAGGVRINLTAADTVIFYDSDWNPTVDQQAMDRAHRLGQTKPVTVYRLVTSGSIEERIMERANKKDAMQRSVIHGQVFNHE